MAEGLGDGVNGAALARAIEPGTDGAGHTRETSCLNCGTKLVGPYCHACGQRGHVHRTLGAFFHDLLHGVLHFEGKTWRTVPMLAWQPGKLTREYIDGKRASYVSPIALFLFVVFLTFAVFNAIGGGIQPQLSGIGAARTAFERNEKEIARLETQLPSQSADDRARTEEALRELREDQDALSGVLGAAQSDFVRGWQASGAKNPFPKDSQLGRLIQHVRANPQLAIYKAQTNAYKYSWMLIPLSVPFVWLLFPFSRRFRGYDHTVFVTYSITFMLALVAAASLMFYANAPTAGLLLLLYAPFHMYRQLRGAYDLTRFGALWRLHVLGIFVWVAIALFAVIISWMAGS